MVNNIVITLHGDRWLLDLLWSFHNVSDVKSLGSTPETNIISHVNYNSILNFQKRVKKKFLGQGYVCLEGWQTSVLVSAAV